jgi:hypothetical protein
MTTVRLAFALITSSLVLTATSGGALAFWPSALLWAAPLLVAVRCLPLLVSLPMVVLLGGAGRAFAFHSSLDGGDGLLLPLLASAALVPAFLLDRVLFDRLPRASMLAWPLGLVATVVVLRETAVGGLLAPLPELQAVRALGIVGGTSLVAFIAQAFGGLGSVLNVQKRGDRFSQAVREAGIRWGALTAFAVAALVFVGHALFGAD